jgi:hypothetical protein
MTLCCSSCSCSHCTPAQACEAHPVVPCLPRYCAGGGTAESRNASPAIKARDIAFCVQCSPLGRPGPGSPEVSTKPCPARTPAGYLGTVGTVQVGLVDVRCYYLGTDEPPRASSARGPIPGRGCRYPHPCRTAPNSSLPPPVDCLQSASHPTCIYTYRDSSVFATYNTYTADY